MREFYMQKKGNPLAPDFELPCLDANQEFVPLIDPVIMKQFGDRFEAILAAVNGLKVCTALSLLEAASKAVMQCPVCTKDDGASIKMMHGSLSDAEGHARKGDGDNG